MVESEYSDTEQARNQPISELGVFLIPEPIRAQVAEGFCRTESHSAEFHLLVFEINA